MKDLLFPHEHIRPIQQEVIRVISQSLQEKKGAVLHAPTGLGKTAASIAPALTYALENDKKILFLTSRNTQHKIAIETVKAIKERFSIPLVATDIIGKKWMCLQPGVTNLSSSEFSEYCKALREDKKCSYYEGLKQGENLSTETKLALVDLLQQSPLNAEDVVAIGKQYSLCPYELGMLVAKQANIVITDYYYVFHPRIRESFLKKNEIDLQDTIIIIDEGHNLPDRIKDLASTRISGIILQRAAKEAHAAGNTALADHCEKTYSVLKKLLGSSDEERYVDTFVFQRAIEEFCDYQDFIKQASLLAEKIREEKKISALGSVAEFLEQWQIEQEGFTKILHKKRSMQGENIILSNRCLDPSVVSKEMIALSHSTILMSGTLTPPEMYSSLLGFEPATFREEFPSPFPQENRLNLIIAKTSTKYTARSSTQFQEIAQTITEIVNATPGNSAIFFPSYYIKEQVERYLHKIEKTVFQEIPGMSTQEKDDLINSFRGYKNIGAVLLAVVSGSFGEGIDLPGDELKTVVVVGLPLAKPDLETKALIEYYDKKFKNGWNYGYVFPAFNRVIQNAGRCIRSETDKGVIVFLDERYTWNQYYQCFPKSWKMKVSLKHYEQQIKDFFSSN